MDAERIARLYREGRVTAPQILRAAAQGLIPLDAVPEEIEDASGYVAAVQQIRADVEGGLQAIRAADDTLDAIIGGAGPIENYDPGSKTAVQVLADVVPAVKQLATGVRLLAEIQKLALNDIDYLARLQLRLIDTTTSPPAEEPAPPAG